MDIVVEDGTGIVTANAYASVDEVTEILSVNIHSKWGLLSDDAAKANLIIWASRILDERVRWAGKKLHHTSGMAWPRTGVRDKEGFPVDDNVVPLAVKVAVATLADHLLSGNPEAPNSGSNITQLQVDVVMIRFDANLAPEKWPLSMSHILKGLGFWSGGRGGYKRIVKH